MDAHDEVGSPSVTSYIRQTEAFWLQAVIAIINTNSTMKHCLSILLVLRLGSS
jgi:hypothetical protein